VGPRNLKACLVEGLPLGEGSLSRGLLVGAGLFIWGSLVVEGSLIRGSLVVEGSLLSEDTLLGQGSFMKAPAQRALRSLASRTSYQLLFAHSVSAVGSG